MVIVEGTGHNDPTLTDQALKAEDFRDGAAEARARAIEAYQEVVKAGKPDAEVAEHLRMRKAGQDTGQRKW